MGKTLRSTTDVWSVCSISIQTVTGHGLLAGFDTRAQLDFTSYTVETFTYALPAVRGPAPNYLANNFGAGMGGRRAK
jgi:hypothetical protein